MKSFMECASFNTASLTHKWVKKESVDKSVMAVSACENCGIVRKSTLVRGKIRFTYYFKRNKL